MEPKRLALVRHAKSSWADPALADHDRPLNARGRRAAALVGEHLRAEGMEPDLVLCSSATRARQTLELFELAPATDIVIEDQLYGAAARELLVRMRRIPARVGSAMVIGHNPGLEELVERPRRGPRDGAGEVPDGGGRRSTSVDPQLAGRRRRNRPPPCVPHPPEPPEPLGRRTDVSVGGVGVCSTGLLASIRAGAGRTLEG